MTSDDNRKLDGVIKEYLIEQMFEKVQTTLTLMAKMLEAHSSRLQTLEDRVQRLENR